MSRRSGQFAPVVAALLVLLSGAVAGGVVTAQEAGPEPADEVYVSENGDAVLVYEGDSTETQAQIDVGVDVASGLFHGLVTVSDTNTGNVTGDFVAMLSQSAVAANGSLQAPRPDALESLSFDLEGVVNDQTSTFDTTLSATIQSGSVSLLLAGASTQGQVTSGPDRLHATGQFSATSPFLTSGPGAVLDVSLAEDDGTYRMDVAQQRQVPASQADAWQDRSAVEQRLRQQFSAVASQFGGQATVSVEQYSFTQDGEAYQLDMAYTATVSDVQAGIEQTVRETLTDREGIDAETAATLAENFTDVSINEASLAYDTTGTTITGDATIDLAEYAGLLETYTATMADLPGSDGAQQSVEQYRAYLAAQQAANLTTQFTWDADVTTPDTSTTAVTAELHSNATNWPAYVDELEARGVPMLDTMFELNASTSGDHVVASGQADYSGEQLVTGAINQLMNGSDVPPQTASMLRAFKSAEFEGATVHGQFGETATVEFGASFADLAALRDAITEAYPAPEFSSVLLQSEDGITETYVRLPGALSGEATESGVRALPTVGPETTVHLPGTWDREFPTVDTERASQFLDSAPANAGDGADGSDAEGSDANGSDGSTDTDAQPSGSSGPGFGVIATLAALLGAGLLALRRSA